MIHMQNEEEETFKKSQNILSSFKNIRMSIIKLIFKNFNFSLNSIKVIYKLFTYSISSKFILKLERVRKII
jgi:hypothetical protein